MTGAGPIRCIACGGESFAIRVQFDSVTIFECTNCNLGETWPTLSVDTSDYASRPDLAEGYAAGENLSFEYSQAIIDVLTRHVTFGSVLDVGCSVGALVEVAHRAGFDAEGIDLDYNAIEIGKKKGRTVATSTLNDWSKRDYVAICLQHTLEHLLDPVAFLRECRSHLRDGGYIVIVVPCHDGLHPRLFRNRWYGWQMAQHYFHYSKKSICLILSKAGFETDEAFQNSMDHRPKFRKIISFKDGVRQVLQVLMYGVATVGGMLGRGDQLVLVAKKVGE